MANTNNNYEEERQQAEEDLFDLFTVREEDNEVEPIINIW